MGYFFVDYKKEQAKDNIKKYFDFNAELLLKNIEEGKLTSLTMSLLLSQNQDIKSCNTNKECKKILKNYISILEKLYGDIRIHIHSKDLKSIIRSWEDSLYGDNLQYFRHTIYEAMQTKKPTSGIEIGRCGPFIRGVSPIFLNDEFNGSVEVMVDFKSLYELAKRQGYELFILIKDNYKFECLRERHMNIHNFTLLDKNSVNLNLIPLLESIDLKNNNLVIHNSHYFYSKNLYDFKNNHIGYIVMHISKDKNDKIANALNLIAN